ncbi:HEPN domain-containing protein [Pseudonocardia alni]|uniref:HEPN domain-containing protein n=1 Tax=Pseudonocardia alni TaxID=33907 RepID=UPI003402A504
MPAPALQAAQTLLSDVDVLIRTAEQATGGTPGRPAGDLGPLKRAATALCYTAWEVYVEDSLIWLAERAGTVSTPGDLPAALRVATEQHAKGSDPWILAGEGWRQAVADVVTDATRGRGEDGSGGLNTANSQNVEKLQQRFLGESLLAKCRWQRRTNAGVRHEIDRLVTVRGRIVHRGETPDDLELEGVRFWRRFINRLCEKLDGHVEAYAESHLAPR